jgi:hypothetical protein
MAFRQGPTFRQVKCSRISFEQVLALAPSILYRAADRSRIRADIWRSEL